MPSLAAAKILQASWRASDATLAARLRYLDDLSRELESSRSLVLLAGTLAKVQESTLFVLYVESQRALARATCKQERAAALKANRVATGPQQS